MSHFLAYKESTNIKYLGRYAFNNCQLQRQTIYTKAVNASSYRSVPDVPVDYNYYDRLS